MEVKETYDFSGYVTRNNLKCSDGRTIRRDAFKDDHGKTVPVVWQHMIDEPSNVLGHAVLENRSDGVYGHIKLNDSKKGRDVKLLVEHGDIKAMSIHATGLKQIGGDVVHGIIREVSLVLAGANPGAFIDNLSFSHSDGTVNYVDDEALIYFDSPLELSHADEESDSEETIEDVFNSMTDKQKEVVYYMVGKVAEGDSEDEEMEQDAFEEGDDIVKRNVFDKTDEKVKSNTLTHSEQAAIFADAQRCGSLKEAFLSHAETNGTPGVDYGIENIDVLFPEYRNVPGMPQVIDRDQAWVQEVTGRASKTPFARIRSWYFDITADVARARGYKKGTLKKEEVIKAGKRVTGPTTIYKKQKLDRDDIIDITDFDVVAFLKQEMQGKLREEIARAILIGDGRDDASEDKIDEASIRPIYKEEEAYAFHVEIDVPEGTPNDSTTNDWVSMIDAVKLAMIDYDGSGSPTMFTTKEFHTKLSLIRDRLGRKLYESDASLAQALGVSNIVDVPVMKDVKSKDDNKPLYAIVVNMKDYNIGMNRGGETTFFDDFDIDYNQYKYLYETRMSGALTRFDSAVILEGKTNP